MGFLAQLRQQQSDSSTGLKLCYLLRIEQPAQRASLSLALAELRQGRPVAPVKPYLIQSQQLQRPPPFLEALDIALLQSLLEASPDWLADNNGELPKDNCHEFLHSLIDSRRCFVETSGKSWLPLELGTEQTAELYWAIDDSGEQRLRWCSQTSKLFCVSNAPFIYEFNSQACRLSAGISTLSQTAIETVQSISQPLAAASVAEFQQQHQHRWHELGLPLPKELPYRDIDASISPVLHCFSLPTTADGERHFLRLEFRYCSEQYCVTYAVDKPFSDLHYWDGTALIRLQPQQQQQEFFRQSLMFQLNQTIAKEDTFQSPFSDQKFWMNLLTKQRSQLEADGFQFFIEPGFRHHYVTAQDWRVRLDHADGDDAHQLSLQFSADGITINLQALLAQLQGFNHTNDLSGETCIELADGRLLLLPAERISDILTELGDWRSSRSGGFRIPNSQLYRLQQLRQQLPEDTQWQGEVEALEWTISLHQTPVMIDKLINGVKAQLRPYQWLGVCWLQHLKQHRVNGLLADDMGLGKTLQTLAHLSLEHQQGLLKEPALIIAPTSLLHNWANEIEAFVPHLRQLVVHGAQRHQHWSRLHDYDIIITSYALVVNDLDHWQQQSLSWVILDEAQVIKNPGTRVSQAVREIESDYRLCLSGTPVENHLGELWSILDFLMPNCLGSRSRFKSDYQKPIEQDGDHYRLQALLTRIAPFMLRRQKDQVAQDLPAKTEIYQSIYMEADQQALYQKIKSEQWREIQQQIAEQENTGQQKFLLLTALLKLRQACCDPKLLDEHSVSSAKRVHCIEMISELVEEGRAVLVFSQFTGMLDLLAADLQRQQIDYLMLTGKTRNREQLVKAFQTGEAPVFLISLKAGGVGLNLTRADTVIHFDPWWNSAAEQQASDRAHRIGQDKPVFVYKLIVADSIEEKIAQLQQRKAILSQHVNHQAQTSGREFALKLEDLLSLWQEESLEKC